MRKRIGITIIFILMVLLCYAINTEADSEICACCTKGYDETTGEYFDNCDEGWCADFVDGNPRCVPDHIGPDEPYTCRTTCSGESSSGGGGGG